MSLLMLDDVKAQLHIPEKDSSVDAQLNTYMTAATQVVERHTGQLMEEQPVTEIVEASGGPLLAVLRGPVGDVTSVESLDGSRSWDTSGMTGDGSVIHTGGQRVSGAVKVTYTAGMTDIPPNCELAAMIIVQHLWETRRGSMPLVVGELDDSVQVPGLGFAVPNRALELLGAPAAGVA